MNAREVVEQLRALMVNGDITRDAPVVMVGARGAVVDDVQPCMWNETTGSTLSPDDVDVGHGYVPAVALLAKGEG